MSSECHNTLVAKCFGSDTNVGFANFVVSVMFFTCFHGILKDINKHFINFKSFFGIFIQRANIYNVDPA